MAADSKYPMTSICYFSVLTMAWLGSAILAALAYLLHLPTMSFRSFFRSAYFIQNGNEPLT